LTIKKIEPPQNQPNSGQRVVVVEDEHDLRQLTAEVLIDAGYQVDVAEDGATAWAALQLSKYDLLITDQFMPKVSGVELPKKKSRCAHDLAGHHGHRIFAQLGLCPAHLVATGEDAAQTLFVPEIIFYGEKYSGYDRQWQ
jgi:PleD family two-component response regulator